MAGDSLIFAGNTRLTNNNDIAANTAFNDIAFSGTAGAFTLGGNALTLAGDVTNNSTATQTINLAMRLSGNRTFDAAVGNITVGGVVSETGGAWGLTKTGANTLTLSGANTYTGVTTVNNGILVASANVSNGGVAGAFGAASNVASNIVIDGGYLGYSGAAAASTDRGFTLTDNGGGLYSGSAGGFTVTGAIAYSGAAAKTLTLWATAGSTGTLQSVIADNGAAPTAVNIRPSTTTIPSGTWVLDADNTYSGDTFIYAETLKAGRDSTATAGPWGLNSKLSLATSSGIARIADINGHNVSVGSIAGGTAGTGIVGEIKLTQVAGKGTLTTGGDNTNQNFQGTITGNGNLVKAGTGTQTLSGPSTYTGTTAIQNGALSVSSINSVSGGSASSSLGAPITVANGTVALGATTTTGALVYTGTGETTDRVLNLAGTTGGGTVDQSGTGLLKFASATTATGSGIKTLTLQGSTAGTGEMAGAIVNNSGTNTTSVTKAGTGTWTLSGANAYTGGTTVNQGTLNVSGDQSAANGGWAINATGATTVNFQGGSTVVVASGKSVTFANNSANAHILNVAGSVTNAGGLTVQAGSTFNINSGANWTQSGAMTVQSLASFSTPVVNVNSGGVFTYTGASAISLSSASGTGNGGATLNLSGGTFITGRAFNNASTGTGTGAANLNFSNGGTLKLSANIAVLATTAGLPFNVQLGTGGGIVDTNGFSTTITQGMANVSGQAGSLTKIGAGTLTLSGTSTYTGATTVNAGVLSVATIGNGGVAGNLGQASSNASNLVLGGGTLQYTGATASTDRAFTLTAGTTSSIDIATGGNSLTFSGSSAATTGALTKIGAGTLVLSGTNAYTGATTVNAGVLSVGSIGNGGVAGNLGQASSNASNLVLGGGTLRYTGATAGTDRSFTLAAATTSFIDVTTNTLTLSGASAATNGALTKMGAGTLVLSGANAHTGATAVNAGTLLINGTHNAGAGAYTVASGGKFGGTGAITTTGTVTVTGQITGGDFGGVGTLSLANAGFVDLTGGTYLFDVNYNTASGDVLRITGAAAGTVSIAGGTFKLGTALGATPAAGSHYAIKLFESNVAVNGASTGQSNYAGATSGLASYQSIVSWDGGKSYYLVPEPGSLVLLGLGSLLRLHRPIHRRERRFT